MIRAVIFDMDGVLIDAKEWHYEALNRALRLFGHEISRYEHLSAYDGLPTRKKLDMLSTDKGLPIKLHPFINDMKQLYTLEMVHSHCRPRFMHEYALSKLKTAGYKLAVASNSVRNSVEIMMEKARLTPYLDLMLSNEDVGRAKPDPEIYQTAMQRLGVKPHEALVVEDNDNGIRAAQAAGAHLMIVETVDDTRLPAILARIAECERTSAP